MSRFGIRTRNGLISSFIEGVVGVTGDADADAYFARVTAAGGTLTQTEKDAITGLVINLKLNGLWTLMKAIYPMVGASAAACVQNLKSSSFTGTFTSGWTFAANGVTPNGTSAYLNTAFNPVAQGLTSADCHISYYARTIATTSDPAEIGNFSDIFTALVIQSRSGGGLNRFFCGLSSAASRSVATAPIGLLSGSAVANTRRDLYVNGVSLANNTSTDTATLGNYPLYIGGANLSGSGSGSFTNSQCAFASIGNGMTSGQAGNFYTAVQTFQTSLSRQV